VGIGRWGVALGSGVATVWHGGEKLSWHDPSCYASGAARIVRQARERAAASAPAFTCGRRPELKPELKRKANDGRM